MSEHLTKKDKYNKLFYMNRIMKSATIRDIAREAGVSVSVVSAVINKKDNQKIFVGEKKKRKILELIEKYNYIPQKSARALASQRTNTMGIIFNSLTPTYAHLLSLIEEEISRRGWDVAIYITDDNPEREEKYLHLMRDGRVDGVIVAAFTQGSPERYRRYFSLGIKIVVIGPFIEGIPGVYFEEKKAGRVAAEHLVEIGCKRLCFFGGWKDTERAREFEKYVLERGLPKPLNFTREDFVDKFSVDKELAKEFFNFSPLPDGVFATNDLAGIALMVEALRRGIKVPQDIAIMGMDNAEICEYTYPSLTSIDLNMELRAKLAIEKLIQLINNEPLEELHTQVPFKLVIRESTKKYKERR